MAPRIAGRAALPASRRGAVRHLDDVAELAVLLALSEREVAALELRHDGDRGFLPRALEARGEDRHLDPGHLERAVERFAQLDAPPLAAAPLSAAGLPRGAAYPFRALMLSPGRVSRTSIFLNRPSRFSLVEQYPST